MDKWIECNPKSHLEVDKWQEREDNSLDPCLTNRLGEGEQTERREGRRRGFERERESTFSLDFSAIGPLNSHETIGKVDPHYKSYAWVPVLWSFDKL